MRFRRTIAVLSSVCARSFTLGRADTGCEKTSADMSAAETPSAHGGAHTQSHDGVEHEKSGKSSTVVCCSTMTSCGLSVQLANAVSTQEAQPTSTQLPSVPFQPARNQIAPPEPPPPKA